MVSRLGDNLDGADGGISELTCELDVEIAIVDLDRN
jgi:hypothetical protein